MILCNNIVQLIVGACRGTVADGMHDLRVLEMLITHHQYNDAAAAAAAEADAADVVMRRSWYNSTETDESLC